jgi:sugar lactone lactonase YvrE
LLILGKKDVKPSNPMDKKSGAAESPRIERVVPQAAIPGGEVAVWGRSLVCNGNSRPTVRFGGQPGTLLLSSSSRLVVRVPEGAVSGNLTVDTGNAVTSPEEIAVGLPVADNLHPVANPVIDNTGNIYTTFSGSRGQKVPVSVFKIDTQHNVQPFLSDLINPTGLALGREGMLYISSRMEGTIFQVSPGAKRSKYAEGMGTATGLAFDPLGNLYVGDRTGTIFKINSERQIFVFATIEPSVSAYHLAFGTDGHLYVTGPTTSSFDRVYRISPDGVVNTFYRGLGRPQGLAFDVAGNLYVAASLFGRRGVVRITPSGSAELVVSGNNIVGLAFTPRRSMVVATNSSLIELFLGIEGKPIV